MVDRGKPPPAQEDTLKPPFGTMLFVLCVRHLGTHDGDAQKSPGDAQSALELQATLQTVPLHVNLPHEVGSPGLQLPCPLHLKTTAPLVISSPPRTRGQRRPIEAAGFPRSREWRQSCGGCPSIG